MYNDNLTSAQILSLLDRIHKENIITTSKNDQQGFSEEKLDAVYRDLNLTSNQIIRRLTLDFIDIAAVTNITPEWKFMSLNFYCLHLLNIELNKEDLLSVVQTKDLKKYVTIMVHVGILQNLNKKLAQFKAFRSQEVEIEDQYYMLKASVCGLFKYAFSPTLRYYLLAQVLLGLLIALFQLAYCPIKKPSSCKQGEFMMTKEFYSEVLADQVRFRDLLETIRNSVSSTIYLKDVMILFGTNTQSWLIKAISSTLTSYIKQQNGLENIVKTILTVIYDDKTIVWKVIDVITLIVVKTINAEDFNTLMGSQINNLLIIAEKYSEHDASTFERLYASIVKSIYCLKPELGELFFSYLFMPLKELSEDSDNTSSNKDLQIIAEDILQRIKVIHYIFLDTKEKTVPLNILKPFMGILFKIYVSIANSSLILFKSDIHDIILHYVNNSGKTDNFSLLENILFGNNVTDLLNLRSDIMLSVNFNKLKMEISKIKVKHDVIKEAHSVYAICKSDTKLFFLYFSFLLNCLCYPEKFFPDVSLLEAEDEGCLSTFEKKIAVYEVLSILAADSNANKYFTDNIPEEVMDYFDQIFISVIKRKAHKNTTDCMFQVIFTIGMILEGITSSGQLDLENFGIRDSIRKIYIETTDQELKTLLYKVLNNTTVGKLENKLNDEVEEAIQETFDEAIPLKGHGLMSLEKMIKSKNPKAVERKQYIFTIFKDNLSNRDTYVYLSAIKGLASMIDLGSHTTNMVLETLCEEYTEFPRDEFGPDSNEMRLKIGEILVQISKKLGDMAPNYKSLLLNTFLNGTKDEDHLVRASALANLGETCKVLGFKLGSIVTEILMCVHAIISTDKYSEPRRAAVGVIRELLAGLGTEMLTILRDDILVCYRTLKFLYETDSDEVLKMHSQLALDELNKNMQDLMLPQVEINPEKKIVILK